jgi:hypothetical protein
MVKVYPGRRALCATDATTGVALGIVAPKIGHAGPVPPALHGAMALHGAIANVDDARGKGPCLEQLEVDPLLQGREVRRARPQHHGVHEQPMLGFRMVV